MDVKHVDSVSKQRLRGKHGNVISLNTLAKRPRSQRESKRSYRCRCRRTVALLRGPELGLWDSATYVREYSWDLIACHPRRRRSSQLITYVCSNKAAYNDYQDSKSLALTTSSEL